MIHVFLLCHGGKIFSILPSLTITKIIKNHQIRKISENRDFLSILISQKLLKN